MVRILANGDIVQDDDPRVRQSTQNRDNFPRPAFFNMMTNAGPAPQQHYQQQQQHHHQQQQGARPGERSPFSDINQQLVNMGFPTWNLGNQVVEPIMSILLLFLLMMVGVRGLLLVGLIYVVSQLSQR
ncbi:protein FAM241B [Sceloporus undulatus]|uniref:protein FAM241B n=1 Tax=Sceloporus undulatus TaxID=8520 RepID=UPI001C4BA717|nr:protein FAM241B [Sceloporus undulatus]